MNNQPTENTERIEMIDIQNAPMTMAVFLTENCSITCYRIDKLMMDGMYLLTIATEEIYKTATLITERFTNVELPTDIIDRLQNCYIALQEALEMNNKQTCSHFQFLFNANTFSFELNIQ